MGRMIRVLGLVLGLAVGAVRGANPATVRVAILSKVMCGANYDFVS